MRDLSCMLPNAMGRGMEGGPPSRLAGGDESAPRRPVGSVATLVADCFWSRGTCPGGTFIHSTSKAPRYPKRRPFCLKGSPVHTGSELHPTANRIMRGLVAAIMEPLVVILDGECGLCNRASHFGMRHSRQGALRFVASQSDEGQALLRRHGLEGVADDTMVAVGRDRAFVRSSAVIQVSKRLRWPWRAQAIVWLVPKPLRDAAYDWVSRRRGRL